MDEMRVFSKLSADQIFYSSIFLMQFYPTAFTFGLSYIMNSHFSRCVCMCVYVCVCVTLVNSNRPLELENVPCSHRGYGRPPEQQLRCELLAHSEKRKHMVGY